MNIAIQKLAAWLLLSLCTLTGIFAFAISINRLKRIVPVLVALAVGGLLGDTYIHLIPDAVERHGSVSDISLIVLMGIFGFLILEKLGHWRHDHHIEEQAQEKRFYRWQKRI